MELLARNTAVRAAIRQRLNLGGVDGSHLTYRTADYADVWIRDHGPTFVTNPATSETAMVHWMFNAWGGKYEDLFRDGEIPGFLSKWLHMPVFNPGIVLEGGSVDVNGLGTIMTTRSCLLNPNRNPGHTPEEIEERLRIILAGPMLYGWTRECRSDTDRHIDDIARFTGPHTIVCAWEDDKMRSRTMTSL